MMESINKYLKRLINLLIDFEEKNAMQCYFE